MAYEDIDKKYDEREALHRYFMDMADEIVRPLRDYRAGLEELVTSKKEITEDDIKMFAESFWYPYFLYSDDPRLGDVSKQKISVESGYKKFIAIAGDWAMKTSLKDFAVVRAPIFLNIIENSYKPTVEVLTKMKSEYDNLIPDNFEAELMEVFSEANHSLKAKVLTILGDTSLQAV